MLYVNLFFLLIINTILEFLPVSSTAHFLLLADISKLDNTINLNLILSFSQLAITFYLLFYFKEIILDILKSFYKKEKLIFCFKVFITMLPTAIFGFLFYNLIKKCFYDNISISLFLLLGSLLMYFAEKVYNKNSKTNLDLKNSAAIDSNDFYNISYATCLKIGFLQMFSLIPGISRSATTISGGLLSGLSRKNAVLFSFFIAIPVSFCAAIFDIYKNYNELLLEYNYAIFAFIFSIIFSFIFVRKMLDFLQNIKLDIFIYYRIVLALLILVFNYVGY